MQRRNFIKAGTTLAGSLSAARSSLLAPMYLTTIGTGMTLGHPVRWACQEALNSDGSLTVPLRKNDDPRFRKGV